jgi:hypothetical protein
MANLDSTVSCLELQLRDPLYPDLEDVLDYWESKRHGRFVPSRSDIEPLDLIRALPRIMLADVIPDPLDFRYRLSGTAITDVHGSEFTGLSPLDLKPPEYGRLIFGHYRQCVAEERPLMHLILLDSDRRGRAYARLLLPLSNDGASVTMLMAVDSENQDFYELKDYFSRLSDKKA